MRNAKFFAIAIQKAIAENSKPRALAEVKK